MDSANMQERYFMKKDKATHDVGLFMSGASDILTLHQELSDGYMDLTGYSILPGIFLMLNDIHTQIIPNRHNSMPGDVFLINYCMDGRCEFKISNDNYSYIDHGLMNVSSTFPHDDFYYPSSEYLGYEIYILPGLFDRMTADILGLFSIDIDSLFQTYANGAAFYAPDAVLKMWSTLPDEPDSSHLGQIRLTTLQILKYLCDHESFSSTNTIYLTKTQAMLAKKLKEILTADLSRHISVGSVAASLHVSETSLKRYFHAVYGMNVSQYLNCTRMAHAAELLADSRLSIADIARECGYANQGRFANVFRTAYSMKPLDYRRAARMNKKQS